MRKLAPLRTVWLTSLALVSIGNTSMAGYIIAKPSPRIVVSQAPSITCSLGAAAVEVSQKRYPSLGGGWVNVVSGGQLYVFAYQFNQTSINSQMAHIREGKAKSHPGKWLLDYSGYRFWKARGLQMTEGTRIGKASDGSENGIIEFVVDSPKAECDFTALIKGHTADEVRSRLQKLEPRFESIAETIAIR